jgi:hypothetical protein
MIMNERKKMSADRVAIEEKEAAGAWSAEVARIPPLLRLNRPCSAHERSPAVPAVVLPAGLPAF